MAVTAVVSVMAVTAITRRLTASLINPKEDRNAKISPSDMEIYVHALLLLEIREQKEQTCNITRSASTSLSQRGTRAPQPDRLAGPQLHLSLRKCRNPALMPLEEDQ